MSATAASNSPRRPSRASKNTSTMHGYIDFTGQTCEARVPGGTTTGSCGKPAEAVIDHVTHRCLRLMCGSCALEHVRNRGARVIAASSEIVARLLPKPTGTLRVVKSPSARGGLVPAPAFLTSGSLGRWKARRRSPSNRLQLVRTKR
jgi:hypothetical protein